MIDVRALARALVAELGRDPELIGQLRTLLAAGAPAVPELVTVAAFARARSIGVSTVRQAIRAGRLQAVRVGRAVRVRSDDQIAPRRSSAMADATTPAARAARAIAVAASGGDLRRRPRTGRARANSLDGAAPHVQSGRD